MKVVICGAGIAGLALAQRLGTFGTEVVVLEKAPGPRTQGYMIDFFGPGYDAAEAMGILPRIRELAYRVEEVTYRDQVGRRRSGLRFAKFAAAAGGRVVSIMRPDLERALREHLPQAVDLRYGTSLTQVDNRADGVTVTLTDGSRLDADLLVGADGIHSTVRSQVFGPEREFLRYLGFHTAAYTFHAPDVRAEVAGQFSLTDTIERQLGCYGLRDGRVAVFAVHRTADPTLPADPRAALRREYRDLGWIVPRALAACPPPEQMYYDQVAQVEMPTWIRSRVVLVGDAAYAVSLLAGQGASLGVTGAYVLAEHLSRDRSIDAALGRYEQRLGSLAAQKQQVGRDAVRWFVPATRRHLIIRRVALKLARLPIVDRYVATALVGKPSAIISETRSRRRTPINTG